MASLTVYDQSGTDVGAYEIAPTDLAPKINRQLLHDAVVMYRSNGRQGSARTKSRSDVAGGTKKMYRQKGTGNARAGSRRSGIRRGGGHIFAIGTRHYSRTMPRKALQMATRMAIASKIRDGEIVLIDDLSFDVPKTRQMAGILKALGCDRSKGVLVTTAAVDRNVCRAARNIQGVTVSPASDLNALSVLTSRHMLVTRAAMDAIRDRAKSGSSK